MSNTSPDPAQQLDPASPWLTAAQAAQLLGVQRGSLYSYVSRGLLRAERVPGERGSRYLRSDVSRLARERRAVRSPLQLAHNTLDWGVPVLQSAITLVRDGHLYYRGRDAEACAEHATLEAVAQWLWQLPEPDLASPRAAAPNSRDLRVREVTAQNSLPTLPRVLALWHADVGRAARLAARGWPSTPAEANATDLLDYLQLMCDCLLGYVPAENKNNTVASAYCHAPLHHQLALRWGVHAEHAHVLRRALVLCADHELNASSFAVRVVASSGASLHACLGAGLAALSGPLHGGMTQAIDRQWDAWHDARGGYDRLRQALAEHGPSAGYRAGFGHPLYPQGDPRARSLLAQLPPDAAREALLAHVLRDTGLHPSLDYALVAIQRALALPSGAAFTLFALGRTAGWVAHALEQRDSGHLIRPRATYTGPEPHAAPLAREAAPWPGARRVRRR